MKNLAGKIASFGAFLTIAAIISAVLSLIGYNLRILMWVDMWGEALGWVIRGSLFVGGVALYLLFSRFSGSDVSEERG